MDLNIWKAWGRNPLQRGNGCAVCLGSWVWVNLPTSGYPRPCRSGGGFLCSQGQTQFFFPVQGQYRLHTGSHLPFGSSARRHLYEPTTQDHIRHKLSQMPQWKDKDDNKMPPLLFLKPWPSFSSYPWTQL